MAKRQITARQLKIELTKHHVTKYNCTSDAAREYLIRNVLEYLTSQNDSELRTIIINLCTQGYIGWNEMELSDLVEELLTRFHDQYVDACEYTEPTPITPTAAGLLAYLDA